MPAIKKNRIVSLFAIKRQRFFQRLVFSFFKGLNCLWISSFRQFRAAP